MSAEFGPQRRHRYRLERDLGLLGSGSALFIMLNPSTADAYRDDITITKCRGFAASWHVRRLIVVNLFALRATNPDELFAHEHPLEHRNDPGRNMAAIEAAARESRLRVAAWGATGAGRSAVADRVADVIRLLDTTPLGETGHVPPLQCLGTTRDGHPLHPSRLGYAASLRLLHQS